MSKLKVRGFKGYGTSHPYYPRHVTNLGKSKVETLADYERELEKSNREEESDPREVKISKSFSKSTGEKMKITEESIRKIIKEEIESFLMFKEHKMLGVTWNHTHAFDDAWKYATGTDSVADAAGQVGDAIVDAGKATGKFISDSGKYVWHKGEWLAGEAYEIGAVVGGAMWDGAKWVVVDLPNTDAVRSWTRILNPQSVFMDPAYRAEVQQTWDEINTRELGHPPGATTDYIRDIDNKFTNAERAGLLDNWFGVEDFATMKDKVYSSRQLATTSAEDAIDKFYRNKDLGDSTTAVDFNGQTHPKYDGLIYWGPSTAIDNYQPQYIWLAKKLKKYEYSTKEEIEKLLTKYIEDSSSAEEGDEIHPKGWVSPFDLQQEKGAEEATKIYRRMKMLDANPNAWKFGVYYCERDLEAIRDYLDMNSQIAPYGTRWIFDALDMGADEGYQDCYLVHWTDDPRFLTRRRQMTFRIQK